MTGGIRDVTLGQSPPLIKEPLEITFHGSLLGVGDKVFITKDNSSDPCQIPNLFEREISSYTVTGDKSTVTYANEVSDNGPWSVCYLKNYPTAIYLQVLSFMAVPYADVALSFIGSNHLIPVGTESQVTLRVLSVGSHACFNNSILIDISTVGNVALISWISLQAEHTSYSNLPYLIKDNCILSSSLQANCNISSIPPRSFSKIIVGLYVSFWNVPEYVNVTATASTESAEKPGTESLLNNIATISAVPQTPRLNVTVTGPSALYPGQSHTFRYVVDNIQSGSVASGAVLEIMIGKMGFSSHGYHNCTTDVLGLNTWKCDLGNVSSSHDGFSPEIGEFNIDLDRGATTQTISQIAVKVSVIGDAFTLYEPISQVALEPGNVAVSVSQNTIKSITTGSAQKGAVTFWTITVTSTHLYSWSSGVLNTISVSGSVIVDIPIGCVGNFEGTSMACTVNDISPMQSEYLTITTRSPTDSTSTTISVITTVSGSESTTTDNSDSVSLISSGGSLLADGWNTSILQADVSATLNFTIKSTVATINLQSVTVDISLSGGSFSHPPPRVCSAHSHVKLRCTVGDFNSIQSISVTVPIVVGASRFVRWEVDVWELYNPSLIILKNIREIPVVASDVTLEIASPPTPIGVLPQVYAGVAVPISIYLTNIATYPAGGVMVLLAAQPKGLFSNIKLSGLDICTYSSLDSTATCTVGDVAVGSTSLIISGEYIPDKSLAGPASVTAIATMGNTDLNETDNTDVIRYNVVDPKVYFSVRNLSVLSSGFSTPYEIILHNIGSGYIASGNATIQLGSGGTVSESEMPKQCASHPFLDNSLFCWFGDVEPQGSSKTVIGINVNSTFWGNITVNVDGLIANLRSDWNQLSTLPPTLTPGAVFENTSEVTAAPDTPTPEILSTTTSLATNLSKSYEFLVQVGDVTAYVVARNYSKAGNIFPFEIHAVNYGPSYATFFISINIFSEAGLRQALQTRNPFSVWSQMGVDAWDGIEPAALLYRNSLPGIQFDNALGATCDYSSFEILCTITDLPPTGYPTIIPAAVYTSQSVVDMLNFTVSVYVTDQTSVDNQGQVPPPGNNRRETLIVVEPDTIQISIIGPGRYGGLPKYGHLHTYTLNIRNVFIQLAVATISSSVGSTFNGFPADCSRTETGEGVEGRQLFCIFENLGEGVLSDFDFDVFVSAPTTDIVNITAEVNASSTARQLQSHLITHSCKQSCLAQRRDVSVKFISPSVQTLISGSNATFTLMLENIGEISALIQNLQVMILDSATPPTPMWISRMPFVDCFISVSGLEGFNCSSFEGSIVSSGSSTIMTFDGYIPRNSKSNSVTMTVTIDVPYNRFTDFKSDVVTLPILLPLIYLSAGHNTSLDVYTSKREYFITISTDGGHGWSSNTIAYISLVGGYYSSISGSGCHTPIKGNPETEIRCLNSDLSPGSTEQIHLEIKHNKTFVGDLTVSIQVVSDNFDYSLREQLIYKVNDPIASIRISNPGGMYAQYGGYVEIKFITSSNQSIIAFPEIEIEMLNSGVVWINSVVSKSVTCTVTKYDVNLLQKSLLCQSLHDITSENEIKLNVSVGIHKDYVGEVSIYSQIKDSLQPDISTELNKTFHVDVSRVNNGPAFLFSATGSWIDVNFARPTDRGNGASDCNTLFKGSYVAMFGLVADVTCLFSSDTQLVITLGSDFEIRPGDYIELTPDIIKDKICDTRYENCGATDHALGSAVSGVISQLPSVGIAAPSVIGVCDSIVLDGSTSSHTVPTPPIYKWEATLINSNSPSAVIVLKTLQEYLGNISSLVVFIDSSLVPFGTTRFQLTAVDVFSNIGSASSELLVSDKPYPKVEFVGQKTRTTRRFLRTYIEVAASSSSCGTALGNASSTSASQLQYSWSQILSDPALEINLGVSAQTSSLDIAPYLLIAGKTYTFTVSVTDPLYPAFTSTLSAEISVTFEPLIALISGGDRVVPSIPPKSGCHFCLDGLSDSKDPNGVSTPLQYDWSVCVIDSVSRLCQTGGIHPFHPKLLSSITGSCILHWSFGGISGGGMWVDNGCQGTFFFGGSSILCLSHGTRVNCSSNSGAARDGVWPVESDTVNLPAGVYRFSLVVRKLQHSSEQHSVVITIAEGAIPVVEVIRVSQPDRDALWYPLPSSWYNPSGRLQLLGRVTADVPDSELSFQWTVSGGSTQLDLTATSLGSTRKNLVIPSNSMSGKYVFTLNVTATGSSTPGSANINVQVNAPPAGGTAIVYKEGTDPTSQTEAQGGSDAIVLQAERWVDPEGGGLQFSFGYFDNSAYQAITTSPVAKSRLVVTAPHIAKTSQLRFRITVFDNYGEYTTTDINIKITARRLDSGSVGNVVSNVMQSHTTLSGGALQSTVLGALRVMSLKSQQDALIAGNERKLHQLSTPTNSHTLNLLKAMSMGVYDGRMGLPTTSSTQTLSHILKRSTSSSSANTDNKIIFDLTIELMTYLLGSHSNSTFYANQSRMTSTAAMNLASAIDVIMVLGDQSQVQQVAQQLDMLSEGVISSSVPGEGHCLASVLVKICVHRVAPPLMVRSEYPITTTDSFGNSFNRSVVSLTTYKWAPKNLLISDYIDVQQVLSEPLSLSDPVTGIATAPILDLQVKLHSTPIDIYDQGAFPLIIILTQPVPNINVSEDWQCVLFNSELSKWDSSGIILSDVTETSWTCSAQHILYSQITVRIAVYDSDSTTQSPGDTKKQSSDFIGIPITAAEAALSMPMSTYLALTYIILIGCSVLWDLRNRTRLLQISYELWSPTSDVVIFQDKNEVLHTDELTNKVRSASVFAPSLRRKSLHVATISKGAVLQSDYDKAPFYPLAWLHPDLYGISLLGHLLANHVFFKLINIRKRVAVPLTSSQATHNLFLLLVLMMVFAGVWLYFFDSPLDSVSSTVGALSSIVVFSETISLSAGYVFHHTPLYTQNEVRSIASKKKFAMGSEPARRFAEFVSKSEEHTSQEETQKQAARRETLRKLSRIASQTSEEVNTNADGESTQPNQKKSGLIAVEELLSIPTHQSRHEKSLIPTLVNNLPRQTPSLQTQPDLKSITALEMGCSAGLSLNCLDTDIEEEKQNMTRHKALGDVLSQFEDQEKELESDVFMDDDELQEEDISVLKQSAEDEDTTSRDESSHPPTSPSQSVQNTPIQTPITPVLAAGVQQAHALHHLHGSNQVSIGQNTSQHENTQRGISFLLSGEEYEYMADAQLEKGNLLTGMLLVFFIFTEILIKIEKKKKKKKNSNTPHNDGN